MSRQEVRRILLAAGRYELALRGKGKRSGPLGSVAIEALEYFVNPVDFRIRRLNRSRDAIVRVLKNPRAHGFLDWLRRYAPTGKEDAARRCGRLSIISRAVPHSCNAASKSWADSRVTRLRLLTP